LVFTRTTFGLPAITTFGLPAGTALGVAILSLGNYIAFGFHNFWSKTVIGWLLFLLIAGEKRHNDCYEKRKFCFHYLIIKYVAKHFDFFRLQALRTNEPYYEHLVILQILKLSIPSINRF
jgi:hypothetical protein